MLFKGYKSLSHRVEPDDIDFNKHVNYVYYIQKCYDIDIKNVMTVHKQFPISRNFTGYIVDARCTIYNELKLGDQYETVSIVQGYKDHFYFNKTYFYKDTRLCAKVMRIGRIINLTRLHDSNIEKTQTFAGVPLHEIGLEQLSDDDDEFQAYIHTFFNNRAKPPSKL